MACNKVYLSKSHSIDVGQTVSLSDHNFGSCAYVTAGETISNVSKQENSFTSEFNDERQILRELENRANAAREAGGQYDWTDNANE